MERDKIAEELVKLAKELMGADSKYWAVRVTLTSGIFSGPATSVLGDGKEVDEVTPKTWFYKSKSEAAKKAKEYADGGHKAEVIEVTFKTKVVERFGPKN